MAVTLKSGKELEEPKKSLNEQEQPEKRKVEAEKEKGEAEIEEKIEAEKSKVGVELNNNDEKQKSDEVVPGRMTFPNNPPLYTPPLPFPHRFRKTKLDAQFLNMFKKLEINILFADALAQKPNYIKFIKDIMSNKKKLEAYGIINLIENCSAII